MRIFVTGGTGFIGKAVIRQLSAGGHEVTALCRTSEKAALPERLGARPMIGDLSNPDSYYSVASEQEALVHVGYDYDDPVQVDRVGTETLLDALHRSENAEMLIYTSGTHVLGDTAGNMVDAHGSTANPAPNVTWRPAHEGMVLEAATDTAATAVVRLGMVYGGEGGLTAKLFKSARTAGPGVLVGDGENHWSMVYHEDLAELYALLIAKQASGIFHGVDGHPVRARDVVHTANEVAGGGGVIETWPLAEARKKLGTLADALCLDQKVASRRAREIAWTPRHASFIENARRAFEEWKEAVKTKEAEILI